MDLLDDKLNITRETKLINMKFYAKYNPGAGFKLAIDGLHNMPKKGIFSVLVSLTQSNNLYSDTFDPLQLKFFGSLDWESPLLSPHFNEGYCLYREVEFDKSLCVVFDIRQFDLTKEREIIIKEHSFSVFPVFDRSGYINSGVFQVPLFEGGVKKHLLDELRTSSFPWKTVQDFAERRDFYTKKKLLNHSGYSSVVFRLLDGQREGHLSRPFDHSRMDYSYLPQDKLYYYSYNEIVEEELRSKPKVKKLLQTSSLQMNQLISETLVKALGLTQYDYQDKL